jgi:perosamine synthetase
MIPVNTPLLAGNERKYINECLDTGWISSEGPFIKKFEDAFAAKVGRQHGIAVSNGSVALDAAILCLGLKAGDEVIMPTFTIISCAAAIVRAGAIPVPVDADPLTWNMQASLIEDAITPKTKAIMVVHIYGLPVDMDPVLDICKKHHLFLIEDAAEMHGQTYKGKPCGSFGDISTFSFYPNKHITTGEGGMIVTDNPVFAEKARSLRNLCFIPEKRFVHHELGYNMRMTNLQAALGLAQLEQLDGFVERKRKMGAIYQERLSSISNLFQLPLASASYAENIYWVFGLVANTEELAQQAVAFLSSRQIGTRPFFWCMHEQPVFLNMGWYKGMKMPVGERIARNGFYVPSGLGLSEEEMHTVADALIEFTKAKG